MQSVPLIVALVALLRPAVAITGAAEGFAKGVTGGGAASPVTPTNIDELVSYLGDSETRVIHLKQTFDFTGTEGTTTEEGCAPWGTSAGCQTAINQNGWCDNYQADAPRATVTYDNAATLGITVNSNKSLIGVGNKGVIKGKGLRLVSGVENIIIQNIHITELNPQYVWGGDAITLNNVDMVWIDHVTTSLIGRQHIVLGNDASNRVTISNSKIDGETSWSATCDGYHYWGVYFAGSNDLVTFKNNYIYHTSGRAPKISGNTLLHAVNNYWYDNSGHAFEIDSGGMVLAEGNVFQNINSPVESSRSGKLFSSPNANANAICSSPLGHTCEVNGFGTSGSFDGTDTDFISNFSSHNVAGASSYKDSKLVQSTAGFGTI